MRKFYFLALMAVLFLGFGLLVSCGDDDDDDSGSDDDDDDSGSDDDDDDASGDTWTDSSSGLTWQVEPFSDYLNWEEAISYCENLSLDGGDWRLPTISELRSLIRGCDATELGGSCGVTDGCTDFDCYSEACDGCDYLGGPGSGGAYWPDGMSGEVSWYWSSSPVADGDNHAWGVDFVNGLVNYGYADYYGYDGYARCVRP